MLFCRLSFLVLLFLTISSCGGTDEVQQEGLVTTTFANLFPENQSTTPFHLLRYRDGNHANCLNLNKKKRSVYLR